VLAPERVTQGERSEAKGWLILQPACELRVAEIGNGKAIANEIQPLSRAA
jgi:hypothetical protein